MRSGYSSRCAFYYSSHRAFDIIEVALFIALIGALLFLFEKRKGKKGKRKTFAFDIIVFLPLILVIMRPIDLVTARLIILVDTPFILVIARSIILVVAHLNILVGQPFGLTIAWLIILVTAPFVFRRCTYRYSGHSFFLAMLYE